jgi:hypothetical protein
MRDSRDFCEGKIKGNAARVPLKPFCTWGYRTSNKFLAPCEVEEKPYKSWSFGAVTTLEYALLLPKDRSDHIQFLRLTDWFCIV